jgi:hypothetical protein
MPSSISSSRGRSRRARHLAALGVALATLAGLIVAVRQTAPEAALQADIVTHRRPPGEDYYLAYNRGGQVDHHVLYHGIDALAIDRLRAADVLFLGNSRLMFALNRPTLRRFFDELGLDYYVLGFGHEEQDDFPARIIDLYDLRPSVAVINVDGFFWDDESDWAKRVIAESNFDAWKLQVEAEATHAVRQRLHAVVPHYADLRQAQREFVIYRSRLDGTWFVGTQLGQGSAFAWPPTDEEQPSARSLRAAEAFKRDLERRGTRMILCLVPAPDVSLNRARVVAAHLGVPLVAPVVDGLRSPDRSHLSADSARRFEARFIEDLRPLLRP